MDQKEYEEEIQKIGEELFFIAMRMFGGPVSATDMPKVYEIARKFEEAVLVGKAGGDKPVS
jgi:NAD(P)H-nitrite reductase large subunit